MLDRLLDAILPSPTAMTHKATEYTVPFGRVHALWNGDGIARIGTVYSRRTL